jgi:hypothetical protein
MVLYGHLEVKPFVSYKRVLTMSAAYHIAYPVVPL